MKAERSRLAILAVLAAILVSMILTLSESTLSGASEQAPDVPNQPPQFQNAPPTQGLSGILYSHQAQAVDDDGDTLTFALLVFPAGMAATADGSVAWIPASNQVGVHPVVMTATDGLATTHLIWSIGISVGTSGSSPAPRIALPAPVGLATVGQLYWHKISATGSPAPVMTVLNMPSWLAFDGRDELRGTPDAADIGTTNVITIIASNGVVPDDSQQFTITVSSLTVNGWDVETLDLAGISGLRASLKVDSGGVAHISCIRDWWGELLYATNPARRWQISEVGQASSQAALCMVLDASRGPHIAFSRFGNPGSAGFGYFTRLSGTWAYDLVVPDDNIGMWASFAFDSQGYAHAVYFRSSTLKYATNASGTWQTTTIDTLVGGNLVEWQCASLAIDANDLPHVAYFYQNHAFDLKYAQCIAGSWVKTVVDSNGMVGVGATLALDSGGKAHVMYWDEANLRLKYATNTSSSWSTETVDSPGDTGRYSSIALDAQDHVHVAYWSTPDKALKYATGTFGSWSIEIADSAPEWGAHVSLALDSSGKPHVAYQDVGIGALKYVKRH